jgi:predicted kinase
MCDENTVIVNYDSIFPMLSGGEYKYEAAKVPIYRVIEETAIISALKNGLNVVVDRTNLTRKIRARYIEMGKAQGARIVCLDFGKGNDESLARRQADGRGKSAEKWAEIHANMQAQYEAPTRNEGIDRFDLSSRVDSTPLRERYC